MRSVKVPTVLRLMKELDLQPNWRVKRGVNVNSSSYELLLRLTTLFNHVMCHYSFQIMRSILK